MMVAAAMIPMPTVLSVMLMLPATSLVGCRGAAVMQQLLLTRHHRVVF